MRRKRFGRNDGQTLVEFALVLPIFLLVVIGVFEFGRAITYWHDLNNTAQVAARYAVVNRYPGCTATDVPWCNEGEDNGIGVQRAEPAESSVLKLRFSSGQKS